MTREIAKDYVKNRMEDLLDFLLLDKLQCFIPGYDVDGTGFTTEAHAVALLSDMKHFRSERGADELSVRLLRDRLEHLRYGCAVLGVEVGIDFVEEVERCWIASLDSEDQSQGAKTYNKAG